MAKRKVHMTVTDMKRLSELLIKAAAENRPDAEYLEKLEEELDRAELVSAREIPPDVVTMNSMVRLKDTDSGEELTRRLVFPADEHRAEENVSILSPLGTRLLGCRAGSTFESDVSGSTRKLRVAEILYQPEAAGDLHL